MLNGSTSLADYITRNQVDGVLWKAKRLLGNIDNAIVKNERVTELARTIALIPMPVARETYAKQIGKEYGISWPTFKEVIESFLVVQKKADAIKVRKNKVNELKGDPKTWPFFGEITAQSNGEEVFRGVQVDLEKFIQLLASFGFTRYEVAGMLGEEFAFVRLEGNVIRNVTRNKIIDHIEAFIKNDYNFEKFTWIDSSILLNHFYKGMKTLFSKDLFARVRTENEIIINKDTVDKTFFYYKNGFVEVTKEGRTLRSYEEMSGSVWDTQMINRNFTFVDFEARKKETYPKGVFADFCWMLSGASVSKLTEEQKAERFHSLCRIIGYLVHDFYEYKLKTIEFTDSSLSEDSEGRSGKTMLVKFLSNVRGYCEINGKEFNYADPTKYQNADLGTQLLFLNDVRSHGKNKFQLEDLLNDVTEGYMVKKLYMAPFRKFSKIAIACNKSLNVKGGSQRDRVIEFEVSDFFHEGYTPEKHYGQWLGRDWKDDEWSLFDNFICYCAQQFLIHGMEAPPTINLEARKLINHTANEFVDFMADCADGIKQNGLPFEGYKMGGNLFVGPKDFSEFEFDKKQLFDHFILTNNDFKSWLSVKMFVIWLRQYAELHLKIKPQEKRSGGVGFIQFKEA